MGAITTEPPYNAYVWEYPPPLNPRLYCTNASESSNLVLNVILEHVSMVSEQKTTILILSHCTNILVLNLTLFLWCLIQKFNTALSGVKLLIGC